MSCTASDDRLAELDAGEAGLDEVLGAAAAGAVRSGRHHERARGDRHEDGYESGLVVPGSPSGGTPS